MIISDAHLHTAFSADSDTPMESMIRRGIEQGLSTLCFTEHYDPDYPDNPEQLDFLLDFDAYFHTFNHMKEKYAGQITLLCGIELGVQSHIGPALQDFYEQYGARFDYVLNSCHIVDRLDPYDGFYFTHFGAAEGMERYFSAILENIKTFSQFQAVGHLDYAARYLPSPRPDFRYDDYRDLLDELLRTVIDAGKGIEVNTSGLKSGLPWPNPHMEILKRYRELGGEILTIGSDAHRPEHMAYAFDRLPDILLSAGFRYYTLYREKEAEFLPII